MVRVRILQGTRYAEHWLSLIRSMVDESGQAAPDADMPQQVEVRTRRTLVI